MVSRTLWRVFNIIAMIKDKTKIKVKYVSLEYCVDNFYIDYE